DATLIQVIDKTSTGMGGRLLRRRLLRPSMEAAEIEARLDAVEELFRDTIRRTELRQRLSGVLDLERLLAKVTLGTAGPRELLALGKSLDLVPVLRTLLREPAAARLREIVEQLDDLPEVRERILHTIAD